MLSQTNTKLEKANNQMKEFYSEPEQLGDNAKKISQVTGLSIKEIELLEVDG